MSFKSSSGIRRCLSAAAALVSVVALPSCTSISVKNLPQPGNSYRDGYSIVLEFANVLNLPDRATVVMDGIPVGVVENVAMGKNDVDVTARIDRSVKVPSDVHAELRQATVLGDIYVAIDRPRESGGAAQSLGPNDRVPLAQTTSPAQLEDTIAQLANFVGSGSIQRVQNTIIGINRVTPDRDERVRAIAHRVSANLADLSDNIDTVDHWLNGLSGTVDAMAREIPAYAFWFSPRGQQSWDFATNSGSYISTTIPSVGSIYTGGYWLVPLFESLGIALGAVQKSKWAIEGEYVPWRQLFTDLFLPADKYPAMNIISVQTADGREITENAQNVLRMLGAIP